VRLRHCEEDLSGVAALVDLALEKYVSWHNSICVYAITILVYFCNLTSNVKSNQIQSN
jgi:hypothetical protein